MLGAVIFIVSIILIGLCFWLAERSAGGTGGASRKGTEIPEVVQSAFREFADELMAKENILLQEGKITKMEPLSEVPYLEGQFEYYQLEFMITPESAVENAHGIVLNSKELFAKAGLNDNVVILFYREGEECFEISFMPRKRIEMQGYKAHIETRYRNTKEKFPKEDYAFVLNGKKLSLWENLNGEKPIEDAVFIRSKTDGELAYTAHFLDCFLNDDIEIYSLVEFERKREYIYKITAKSYKVVTPRGIRVGCLVDELKEKYPLSLAYLKNFEDRGPAYAYIPEDDTLRFITFRTEDGIITEMELTEALDERPFKPKDGYIDQDVPWTEVDNSAKFTEKYARSLYLGRHKTDLEARQVFNTFVTNSLEDMVVVEKGLWRDFPREKEQIYFVIYKNPKDGMQFYMELKLKEIFINTFTNDAAIWIVTHYRIQKKRG